MIINNKIDNAIQILKYFESENVFYWLEKLELSNSEKGFIILYLGLINTL